MNANIRDEEHVGYCLLLFSANAHVFIADF